MPYSNMTGHLVYKQYRQQYSIIILLVLFKNTILKNDFLFVELICYYYYLPNCQRGNGKLLPKTNKFFIETKNNNNNNKF